MLKQLGEAVHDISRLIQGSIDPDYVNYLIHNAWNRRRLLDEAIQKEGVQSAVVIGLLQGACRCDPDPEIREWAQGQLQAQNVIPPRCEWPSVGCDGKVYTREEMLDVPDLYVCEPVDRHSFLAKPNGHIKVFWEQYRGTALFGLVFAAIGLLVLLVVLNSSPSAPSYSNSRQSSTSPLVVAIFPLVGLGILGYGVFQVYQRFQESRKLEKSGELYLGQFKAVREGWEIRGSGKSRTRVHYYEFAYLFKTSTGHVTESSQRIYGNRPDLASALSLPLGTPVPVLFSKYDGVRLL